MPNSKIKITERGWAGHFCCAKDCRYRRNTLVEVGEKRAIISSVGNCVFDHKEGIQEIGVHRYYETMCFRAVKEEGYWEANVGEQIYTGDNIKHGIYAKNTKDLPKNVDSDMDEIHEQNVKAIVKILKKENKKELKQ